jgi:hypothetical protein
VDIVFEQSGLTIKLDDQIVEWAKAYETSMLDANELLHLAAVLSVFPRTAESFLIEIGAYLGTTTLFLAKILDRLNKTVPILSIDPFDRFQPDSLNPQGNYSAYMSNIVQNGLGSVCLPLSAFSFDAARVVSNTAGVLVLDGDHHYSSVSRDLSFYMPKIVVGGFLFVDDYGPSYPDVIRAVDEAFADNNEFKIHAKSYFIVAERVRARGKAPRAGRGVTRSLKALSNS